MHKQRLELDWVGKDDKIKLEPRILLEDKSSAYGEPSAQNILIHGDNLLALKALESEFTEKINCIYIDPPYNSGSAFLHYDDGIEHSLWLSLMQARLEILWKLLHPNGSFWISIDDDEMPYLRVLMDQMVGRDKFVAQIVWQKRYSRENREAIGDVHEYVLVYAKSRDAFKKNRNMLPLTDEQKKVYKNPNNDPKGPWRTIPITAQAGHATKAQFYTITSPTGKKFDPPPGNCWRYSKDAFEKLRTEGRIYFGKDGNSQPTTIRYLTEVKGAVPWTWWPHEEVGNTDEAKKEMLALYEKDKIFDTPKPERLMHRILTIATKPGDLILDSFAGSGTTGAVAHKMGRRWIMVELGDHCKTHVAPRLKKVIDGKDKNGITEQTGWQGGGGFKFFELAPSLLQKDSLGNWIISPKYNANQLSEAVCKHEGFKFWPDQNLYWKQGFSTEKDFIFVTTEFLTADRIERIAKAMKPDETLLVCAKAFRVPATKYPNITIKKIPQMLLGRCEFGRDDYSLNVKEPAQEEMGLDEADI